MHVLLVTYPTTEDNPTKKLKKSFRNLETFHVTSRD